MRPKTWTRVVCCVWPYKLQISRRMMPSPCRQFDVGLRWKIEIVLLTPQHSFAPSNTVIGSRYSSSLSQPGLSPPSPATIMVQSPLRGAFRDCAPKPASGPGCMLPVEEECMSCLFCQIKILPRPPTSGHLWGDLAAAFPHRAIAVTSDETPMSGRLVHSRSIRTGRAQVCCMLAVTIFRGVRR
jgi:hypothetical protein